MARPTIQADGREYLFAPDDQPPVSSRWWGLVRARLINDVTGEPVGGHISLESDLNVTALGMAEGGQIRLMRIPLAVPRIANGGLVGLVAIPKKIFPILAGKNYTLVLTVRATGYLPRFMSVLIPAVRTTLPGPKAGDHVIKLNKTDDLQVGEWLMIGNLSTIPTDRCEAVQIVAIAKATNEVMTTPELKIDHNTGSESVVQLTTNAGVVTLVPQP